MANRFLRLFLFASLITPITGCHRQVPAQTVTTTTVVTATTTTTTTTTQVDGIGGLTAKGKEAEDAARAAVAQSKKRREAEKGSE